MKKVIDAGIYRNILCYDADAKPGQFTKRLLSIMSTVMKRNGHGNLENVFVFGDHETEQLESRFDTTYLNFEEYRDYFHRDGATLAKDDKFLVVGISNEGIDNAVNGHYDNLNEDTEFSEIIIGSF